MNGRRKKRQAQAGNYELTIMFSLPNSQFEHNQILSFIRNLLSQINDNPRVSIITYSANAQVEIRMVSLRDAINQVQSIIYRNPQGQFNLAQAYQTYEREIQNRAQGRQVIYIISGNLVRNANAESSFNRIRNSVEAGGFAIGQSDRNALILLSTNQNAVNYVNSYNDLNNQIGVAVTAIRLLASGPVVFGGTYCRTTVDGYICWCIVNNQPINGTECQDTDECRTNNGGCADTCQNSDGSFQCSCRSGFRLAANRRDCDDENECNNNVCGFGVDCVNTYGGFYCLTGVNRPAALAGAAAAAGGMAASSTTIVAVVVSAVNILIVIAIIVVWRRRQRATNAKSSKASASSHAFVNKGAEIGTVKSFNSLASKYTGSVRSSIDDESLDAVSLE